MTETVYLSIKSCGRLGKTGRSIDEVVCKDPSIARLNRFNLSLRVSYYRYNCCQPCEYFDMIGGTSNRRVLHCSAVVEDEHAKIDCQPDCHYAWAAEDGR
jgi:hypothetical protein